VVHSPGEVSVGACPSPLTPATSSCGWSGSGNQGIEAVTAYILNIDMLDSSISKNFPFKEGTIIYNLFR
jgi:hypothetical protein